MKNEVERIFEERGEKITIHEEYDTGFYKVDMYIPELNMILEIDGITHYTGMQYLGDFVTKELTVGTNAKSRTKRAIL